MYNYTLEHDHHQAILEFLRESLIIHEIEKEILLSEVMLEEQRYHYIYLESIGVIHE